jgi:hypothetical protein
MSFRQKRELFSQVTSRKAAVPPITSTTSAKFHTDAYLLPHTQVRIGALV